MASKGHRCRCRGSGCRNGGSPRLLHAELRPSQPLRRYAEGKLDQTAEGPALQRLPAQPCGTRSSDRARCGRPRRTGTAVSRLAATPAPPERARRMLRDGPPPYRADRRRLLSSSDRCLIFMQRSVALPSAM